MKISELYLTKDETSRIELNDKDFKTLFDFLSYKGIEQGEFFFKESAAKINLLLKENKIKCLSINTGFKTVAGTMFRVNGQYFCRKGWYKKDDGGFCFKAAKFHEKRPIYIPEYGDNNNDVYTGIDFIDLCGDVKIAKRLFEEIIWQFPETLYDELIMHKKINFKKHNKK